MCACPIFLLIKDGCQWVTYGCELYTKNLVKEPKKGKVKQGHKSKRLMPFLLCFMCFYVLHLPRCTLIDTKRCGFPLFHFNALNVEHMLLTTL